MKPPTEEELNEEIDDGFGLQYEGEPNAIIQSAIDLLKAELEALEMTAEMVEDRWSSHKTFLDTVVRHYALSIEMETEWADEIDQAAVTHYKQQLQEAKEKLEKETEEYEEGKKRSEEAIDYKKRQIAVVADVLRRAHNGHF